MHGASAQLELVIARVAHRALKFARLPFSQAEDYVHLVLRARHPQSLKVHFLQVRQPLQADLGTLQKIVGQVGALELAQLAAQDLVFNGQGAVETDAAHVNPALGADQQRDGNLAAVFVDLGDRRDLGEPIALLPQAQPDQFTALGDELLGKAHAGLEQHVAVQLRLVHHEIAGQLHVGHDVVAALANIDGDEYVLQIGRQGHLGGFQVEIRVTAIEVVGAELLQVALQGFARIAVVLADEGQPVRRLQFKVLFQFLVGEQLIAHDVDLADARAVALFDVDHHVHLVVGQPGDVHIDVGAVLAATEIKIRQGQLDLFQNRRLDQAAGRNAVARQGLGEILGLDILVALNQQRFDCRLLTNRHNQCVAVTPEFNIGEKARPVQAAQQLPDRACVQRVADVHRQIVQHGALGNPLQALDSYVPHYELILLRRGLR